MEQNQALEEIRVQLQLSEQETDFLREVYTAMRQRGEGIAFERMKQMVTEDRMLSPCFRFHKGEVVLSPVVQAYMAGEMPRMPKGMRLLFPRQEKLFGKQAGFESARKLIQMGEALGQNCAIAICGAKGSGRHFLMEQLCAGMEMPLLYVQTSGRAYEPEAVYEILFSVSLLGAFVCVEYEEAAGCELVQSLSDYVQMIGIIKDKESQLTEDCGYAALLIEPESPDRMDKLEIARELLAENGALDKLPKGISIEQLAARQLAMGEYIRYIRSVALEILTDSKALQNTVFHTQSVHLNLLPATRTFEELKLPKQQYEQLLGICQMIRTRERVMGEWGFAKKFSYGNGMSILFYGAPGTGKTMTAQVMANELHMPLYRVDLSQLISKYIGETQKNIGRIFDEADKCDCILLFDEADAIFSKRSDVSDSQDRYSNAETAYLLQRIEQYQGISILATNLLQNFDDAFRRRISYMVHFPMPDVALRTQLWESIFPQQARVSDEVDALALAQAFELSGSAIKNAALHSAYMAMAQESEIKMCHILKGIQNEYSKTGKNFNSAQLELIEMYQV